MLLSTSAGGVVIAALGSNVFVASGVCASRLAFSAAVTCIATHGSSLVVSCDDKTLSGISINNGIGASGGGGGGGGSGGGGGGSELMLRLIDTVAIPRRCSSLLAAEAPLGAGHGSISVVGDKVGDVSALGILPSLSRRRVLSGHVASIITALTLAGENKDLLCAGDRDEKIIVTSWATPRRIESYCLGHTRAIVSLTPTCGIVGGYAKGELLASAGGDGALRLWHTRSGTLLSSLYFRPTSTTTTTSTSSSTTATLKPTFDIQLSPAGLSHIDEDTTFSKNDDDLNDETAATTGGGGGGGGVDMDDNDNVSIDNDDGDGGGGVEKEEEEFGPLRAIPSPLEGRGSTTLPPTVVPASLITFLSPSGTSLFATFIVGENTIRLLRIVSTGARVAVVSMAGVNAALASGAASGTASGNTTSKVTLEQFSLSPLGTLKLRDGFIPLGLTVDSSSSSSSSSLLVSVASRRTGKDSDNWLPQIIALNISPSSSLSSSRGGNGGGGGGEISEWEWDANVNENERKNGEFFLSETAEHFTSKALSDTFKQLSVSECPSWVNSSTTSFEISRLASPITAAPEEYDKSFVKPKKLDRRNDRKRDKKTPAATATETPDIAE